MTDWLHRRAALTPQRVAIEDRGTGRSITFAELDSQASSLARSLEEHFRPQTRVAILSADRAEVFESMFAAAKAELTLVPLNRRLALNELSNIISHAKPEALIYDSSQREVAAELIYEHNLVGISLDEDALEAHHLQWEESTRSGNGYYANIDLESIPLILYTSGTSGKPKGVKIPWRQIVFNNVSTGLALELRSDWRVLSCLPLFHTGGLHALSTPVLHAGGQIVLLPSFDDKQALELFQNQAVDSMIAVPTIYERLKDIKFLEQRLPHVKALICGGAPLSPQLHGEYHDAQLPLRQGYGMTEVGPNCFSFSPLDGHDRLGTVGFPAPYGEAKVIDSQGQSVSPMQPGELCLRGPHLSAGYFRDEHLTRQTFSADGWFRTGDLAQYNSRGTFSIVGRVKDMFISGGENIYPAEVEAQLSQHPDITSICVLGIPDTRWGEVGAAIYISSHRHPLNSENLRAFCESRLGRFKIPKHWHSIDHFPLNATGKIDKVTLYTIVMSSLKDQYT